MRVPEELRLIGGPLASDERDGCNGAFVLPSVEPGWSLAVIVSDEGGWEHASVRAFRAPDSSRVPTWREMCQVKDEFWGPDVVVMQLHPRRAEYVNRHPHVLHLWRPVVERIPTPPLEFV